MTVAEPVLTRMPAIAELPFLPATALDAVLDDDGRSPGGVRKLRQELRRDIGSDDRAGFLSLGRHGTLNLEPAPLFTCLAAGTVWDRERSTFLAREYRGAGLSELLASPLYQQAMSAATAALRAAFVDLVPSVNVLAAAVATLIELTRHDSVVRRIADRMSRISAEVDTHVSQLKRISGTVVRVDGAETLVAVHVDGRDQLRMLPTALLLSTGLSGNGTAFVLQELAFSPERRGQIVLPAIDLEEPSAQVEAQLDAEDRPLSRP